SELWAAWFNTQAQRGPASLDTACGHFDITQPAPRAELEQHFAAACLGPATTGPGAKAIADALSLQPQSGKPWLTWALDRKSTRRVGKGWRSRMAADAGS